MEIFFYAISTIIPSAIYDKHFKIVFSTIEKTGN